MKPANRILKAVASHPSANEASGFVPAQAIAQSAMKLDALPGFCCTSRAWVEAPVTNAATPAARAANRLAHREMPKMKMRMQKLRASSDQAARLDVRDGFDNAGPLVGANEPSTVPHPSAARKYPAQLLDV